MCMSGRHEGNSGGDENAQEILNRRLAKGETNLEEYQKLKAVPNDAGSSQAATQEVHHH